jgi:tartrate-resistant acid phosphatase type 5
MSIIFYTIGDWGKLTPGLFATSKSMSEISNKIKPDFIISLGDNFYPNGVKSTDDPQWTQTYQNIFNHPNLNCPWYSILGNHDYIYNPQAQIDYYLEKKDERWTMPYNYYSVTKQLGSTTLQIVFIDTVELDTISTYSLLNKDTIKKNNLTEANSNKQLEWIKYVLENSKADWLIVAGHYNMYTGGWHNSNLNLINMLKPLFIKYKVDMYFAGHCHNLEHLSDSGIEYIISGSGAKTGNTSKIYQTKFDHGGNGYTIHELVNDKLYNYFICSHTNKILHSFELNKKRNLHL